MMTNVRPVEILLVEDNPGDVRLTKEALKEGRVLNRLTVVSDGVEALACLRKEGKYVDAPTPELILLDLNLPKRDRAAIQQGLAEKYPQQYAAKVEQYLQNLADETSPR